MMRSVIGAGSSGSATNTFLPLGVLGRDHDGSTISAYQENLPDLRLVRLYLGAAAEVRITEMQHNRTILML
jgi:hypothetical protein